MRITQFLTASLVSVLVLESSAQAVCGNSTLDAGEECEDGNTTNGDGCDDTCAIESGWDCTEAVFELDFFNNYVEDGHASPNWTLSSDGRTVNQSTIPSPVCMCYLPATGVEATFTLRQNQTMTLSDAVDLKMVISTMPMPRDSIDWAN